MDERDYIAINKQSKTILTMEQEFISNIKQYIQDRNISVWRFCKEINFTNPDKMKNYLNGKVGINGKTVFNIMNLIYK
jgi:hypothetical protein